MSREQLEAVRLGLTASDKHRLRMVKHNQELGRRKRGDNHWTRKDPDAMERWKRAMAEGRRKHQGGDAKP